MLLTNHNRTLLRGVLAGAVVLGGAMGCSRSDRANTGRDTAQTAAAVAPADTQAGNAATSSTADTAARPSSDTTAVAPQTATRPSAAPSSKQIPTHRNRVRPAAQPRDTAGYRAMENAATDTAASDTTSTEMANATADTSQQKAGAADSTQRETVAVGLEPTAASEQANADSVTNPTDSARIRPPEDSTEILGATSDTLARDTSVTLSQGDTSQAQTDTTAQVEADTAALQARVDTTTEAPTEVAANNQPDTVTVVGDSSSVDQPGPRAKEDTVSQKGDSLAKYHEADRVRPTVDSTETLGQVNKDTPNYDVEAVGDANGDVVGAAQVESTGNIATGADAVALMSRGGQVCRVENSPDVQWDLASSPSSLNPCGTGTMTLPRVKTGEK